MKHFLVYSSLRLLVLLAVGGLAFAVGLRGWVLLVVAFVGSGALSIFVLSGPRNRLGGDVGGVFHRINERIDAATRAEDDEVVDLEPGVGVQTAEQQVDSEVVEPEHHKA
ncbi:MAG: DUF4229 domain-containing protein [Candidatus Nanopelagicales bacterium]